MDTIYNSKYIIIINNTIYDSKYIIIIQSILKKLLYDATWIKTLSWKFWVLSRAFEEPLLASGSSFWGC